MGTCSSKSSDPVLSDHSHHGAYSLHENLVRERTGRHRFDKIYEVVDEIGHGGLCTIFKIRKRDEWIGGSARKIHQRKATFGRLQLEGFTRGPGASKDDQKINTNNKEIFFALKVINLAMVQVRREKNNRPLFSPGCGPFPLYHCHY
mgnify:CR=1 FL=1